MKIRCFFLVSLLLLALAGGACAPRQQSAEGGPPPLPRRWPEKAQVFRHKVRLEAPGLEAVAFDGVLRLEASGQQPSVRVVGLGGLGMTLFDITIGPARAETAFLHPSLRRIRGVEGEIARCVRAVWLVSIPVAQAIAWEDARLGAVLRERVMGADVEHSAESGGRFVSRASGDGGEWTVCLSPERPWPARMEFSGGDSAYTVHIRLLAHSETVEEGK